MNRPVHRRASTRRAFVLPVVILAMLVVAITSAVMLQRGFAVTGTVNRQIASYRVQHAVRGLQEGVEAWLSQQRARTIAESLDDDGLALTLEPGDGTRVGLYFFDGQGTARADGLAVAEDIRPDVDAIAEEVRRLYGPDGERRYLREAGPYAVSINSAEPELLVAMANVLAPEEQAADLADALVRLLDLRGAETLGQEAITQVMNRVGISGAERTRVIRMLTPQPVLWEAIIVVRGDGVRLPPTEITRYRSLVLVESSSSSGGAFEQPSPFLIWEEMRREDPRYENPRYWEVGR